MTQAYGRDGQAPVVAGLFYPANPGELGADVEDLLGAREPLQSLSAGIGRGRPFSSIATKTKVATVTFSRASVRKRRAKFVYA